MDNFRKFAAEIVCAMWLVIIAIQYLGNYFMPHLEINFVLAYIGMAVLMAVVFMSKIFSRGKSNL